jgi:protein SCO1/2
VKYVTDLYKVFYTKSQTSDNINNYMIDHSSFVYLMDKQGKYMKHFYMNSSEQEIVEYIRINK